ncbi:acetyl-CoA synthetase-like protein [Thozetella sp. PMI_491]|nr:acetyl-CoA synthetase-like protein [Thozetella sp. PMI_491]
MATATLPPSKQRLSIISGPASPPLLDWTFNDLLRNQCEQNPDNVAVVSQHQDESITYRELDRRSEQLAAGLHGLGVRRGDRVGVLLGNRSEYAVIMFACSKLGAYFTLFNYAYTPSELANALKATTPKVLLATWTTCRLDYTAILETVHASITQLEQVILLEDTSRPGKVRVPSTGFKSYADVMVQGSQSRVNLRDMEKAVKDADILNLQFTSGSTGLPKAAALTHHGMLNSARYIGLQMKIAARDSINIPVPLFHAFGLVIGLCTAMMYGASIVLPSEYFDPGETLRALERYKCTGLYGVTTMFVDMLSHPEFEKTQRTSLRFGLMAGSAMPEGLLTRVINYFPIPDVYTNWGMTELSSIATMTTAADPVEKKLKSAGRLLPNFIGKIVDPETAQTLPYGQRGEIVVSGFGVMHSYYGQPDRTAQAIHEHKGDAGRRWMHTGDEGYLDKDGYFVITGRIKDLIIRGGENISPNEIEGRLFQHPAIKQCSVFGVPSARYGEEVAAILELNEGATQRPPDSEIKTWVRKELSRFKSPVYIWWLGDEAAGVPSEWPKTANGKLRKGDIRKIGEAVGVRAAEMM